MLLLVEVRMWGSTPTKYQLYAITDACPGDLQWVSTNNPPSLKADVCSKSKNGGTCHTDTGKCACNTGFVEADCSGHQLPDLPVNMSSIFSMSHCQDTFLSFKVTNDTYELVVDVNSDFSLDPTLMIGGTSTFCC